MRGRGLRVCATSRKVAVHNKRRRSRKRQLRSTGTLIFETRFVDDARAEDVTVRDLDLTLIAGHVTRRAIKVQTSIKASILSVALILIADDEGIFFAQSKIDAGREVVAQTRLGDSCAEVAG